MSRKHHSIDQVKDKYIISTSQPSTFFCFWLGEFVLVEYLILFIVKKYKKVIARNEKEVLYGVVFR